MRLFNAPLVNDLLITDYITIGRQNENYPDGKIFMVGVPDFINALAQLMGNANQFPTVSLSPNDSLLNTNEALILTATAADADGTISKVEIYEGPTLLSTKNSAPWTHSIANPIAGNRSFTAKAYDNNNAVTTSNIVTVTVTQPLPDLGIAEVVLWAFPQSNGSGLSPRNSPTVLNNFQSAYNTLNPQVKTYNRLTGKVEIYEQGVTANSINDRLWNGSYIVPGPAAPSIGSDYSYAESYLADPTNNGKTLFILKPWIGLAPGETANTNSTTTTDWINIYYPKLKEDWDNMKAEILAMGFSEVITKKAFCDLGEGNHAAGTQNVYKAELLQLFSMAEADGMIQEGTERYLMAKQPVQYAPILALQHEIVTENTNIGLLEVANPSFYDGVHYEQASMLNIGILQYNTNGAAPLLQTAFTRAENEYSSANQIVLSFDKFMRLPQISASDIVLNPANTYTGVTVSGKEITLSFSNPFPVSDYPIILTILNNKIKDYSGTPAANLANLQINNWIGNLMPTWTIVPMLPKWDLVNRNNFWRTDIRNDVNGNGAMLGFKLVAGAAGGLAQHYAKPTYAGFVGFKTVDAYQNGIKLPGSNLWPFGFFIDGFGRLTQVQPVEPYASVLKNAVLGNYYRAWIDSNGVSTIGESSDMVNWALIHTGPVLSGEKYGIYDMVGADFAVMQFVQQKGLTAYNVPVQTEPPAGSGETAPLIFTTTLNLQQNPPNTWIIQNNAGPNFNVAKGVTSKKLAGSNGRIYCNGTSREVVLMLSNSALNSGYTAAVGAGFYLNGVGTLIWYDNQGYGTVTETHYNYYSLVLDNRVPALEVSNDLNTWTRIFDNFDFIQEEGEELFALCDIKGDETGKLVNPMGFNFV